ncbi:MAG TPA: DUF2314 domain-containing protein [Polyangiaceae bacterium]|nr:DUF2314 domain-containing protein [Polyangiaceae bacterium]
MRLGSWVSGLALCLIVSTSLVPLAGCKGAGRAIERLSAKLGHEKSVVVGEAPAAGSLVAAQYQFRAAIYHAHAPSVDVHAVVKRLAGERFSLVADDAAAKQAAGASIVVTTPAIADFAPPDKAHLAHFARGLSARDEDALRASQAVTVVTFRGPGQLATTQYRTALELMTALVGELGGYPWDEDTRLVYTAESWKRLLENWQGNEPRIPDHVMFHAYRDEELVRIVSLGMLKFGLPDLAINQVAAGRSTSMGSLANVVCQTLLEKGRLDGAGRLATSIDDLKHEAYKAELIADLEDNAKRRVELQLAVAKREEGDADNRLLEIVFPGSVKSLQERQSAVVSELFGAHDSMVYVQHDRSLEAASARARQKALAIGKRYANGPPDGEQLQVKAPFETSAGGTEWMWVEVVRWHGDQIDGILRNDPFDVPTLKDGSRVAVQANEIFDYILSKADGSQEGNETGELLEAREKAGAEVRSK